MMINKNIWIILAVGLWLLCLLPGSADAYFDPGSGSMLLQAFLATLAAGGIFLGMSWERLRAFFRRRVLRKQSQEGENSTHDH